MSRPSESGRSATKILSAAIFGSSANPLKRCLSARVDCPPLSGPNHRAYRAGKRMSEIAQLQELVESAYERRDSIGVSTRGDVREAVEAALERLDAGNLRVA